VSADGYDTGKVVKFGVEGQRGNKKKKKEEEEEKKKKKKKEEEEEEKKKKEKKKKNTITASQNCPSPLILKSVASKR
jgi:hypothetical protein